MWPEIKQLIIQKMNNIISTNTTATTASDTTTTTNNTPTSPPTTSDTTSTTTALPPTNKTPTTNNSNNNTIISNNNVIVLEAAIMIEAGWYDIVDELWVSVTSTPITINRLKIRNNLSTEEAEKRIKSQINNEERIKYANFVINTDDKPVEEVEKEVAEYFESHILPQIGVGHV